MQPEQEAELSPSFDTGINNSWSSAYNVHTPHIATFIYRPVSSSPKTVIPSRPHGVTTQDINILITVRTSNRVQTIVFLGKLRFFDPLGQGDGVGQLV
jgi:hypothetical protein